MPTSVQLFYMRDFDAHEYLGPITAGFGQIVHEHGILRAVVAARTAIAAKGACRLCDTSVIHTVFE
jgi:hypothetical protein